MDYPVVPTIGRNVWYWPSYADKLVNYAPEQPFHAQIIFVGDTAVNLFVVDHAGHAVVREDVSGIDGDADDKQGCWQWMPYQNKQAAKDAEKEAQIAQRFGPANQDGG